ncbi:MAG: hypothetical protein IPG16_09980 [Comamonadaceae bacterium]|nr:hypothetical protein [Comamonadaceae bacterium]
MRAVAAWSLARARELRGWARHRLANAAEVDDLLQDLFLRRCQRGRFCSVRNPRAWLFPVALRPVFRLRVARDHGGTARRPVRPR